MKTCHIIGAGEYVNIGIDKKPDDIIVACDGGLKYLNEKGIEPDVIIGDFDSLGYVPKGKNVIKLNVIKDETDVGAAIRLYKDQFDCFFLYYCTGGKISHTIANIQNCIALSRLNKEVVIFDKKENITFVTDGSLEFADGQGFFSVFADGVCQGVSISGAKYDLTDATLKSDYPLGVSNEFANIITKISVKKGTLTVTFPINVVLPKRS